MKSSTSVAAFAGLLILAIGGYYVYSMSGSKLVPDTNDQGTTQTPTPGPVVVHEGEHCGGNMQNAPVCASGLHCAAAPGSHLPVGDVGGLCVKDNPAQYIDGNLLLGKDSNTALGAYLIGFNGMTLYTYSKDSAGASVCTDACAINWPPYVVLSSEALKNIQAGVTGKVSSITRNDGSMQVTYNGKPLYFYSKDIKSGDTTGNNVGSVWFVVKP